MANKKSWKDYPTAQIFKILLIVMSVVYAIGFIVFIILDAPNRVKYMVAAHDMAQFAFNLSLFLGDILFLPIYFLILYNLYCLIIMIIKGDPFHPDNPKRIRRVAYGAFGLAIVRALCFICRSIFMLTVHERWDAFVSPIFGEGLRMVLFGVGILIIAHVFEAGVKLKQSDDLTI